MQVRNSKSKTLFSTQGKYYKFQYEIQNPNITFNSRKLLLNVSTKFKIQNIIFNTRKILQISVTKFEIIDVILMCLEILLYKHRAVIKVPGIAKQTVNRK